MEMSNETPLSTPEEDEPDIITHNQSKIAHFRKLGLFLIYWKRTKYEASNRMLMLFYLLLYFGSFVYFFLAYGIREIYKRSYDDYVDRIDDSINFLLVGIFMGIFPSCWNFLLREYSIYLPLVLISAKKLEKTEIYKKHEFSKITKISFHDRLHDEDHNDPDDDINIEFQKSIKMQWGLVKYGPFIGIILSVIVCTLLITTDFIWSIYDINNDDMLEHLIKDLPFFIFCIVYPIPNFGSIWFCIFFIEWQRKIYSRLRKHIRDIKKSTFEAEKELCTKLTEEYKQELENICYMVIKLQKVFILLNKKIFQKTIVLSFTFFLFLDVFCTWKILQNHTNSVYIFPLLIINGHTYLLCKWSNDLMAEFTEIMEVLNEMHEDDVDNIRRKFNECPPQVLALGEFSVNYSMMTAGIAIVLSIISISSLVWPEMGKHEKLQCLKEYCYNYQDSNGGWNNTLCTAYYSYQNIQ